MKTSNFDYSLPQELIAQAPIEPRDHSRLMVVSRDDGSIDHRRFYDLPDLLREGDLLVFNDSRVIPARLYGRRSTGGKVELLLLGRLASGLWRALVRPGRRMHEGAAFEVGGEGGMSGEVVGVEPDGVRLVRLSDEERVKELGVVPLPPYVHQPLAEPERYQTVYARVDGSVAAPTAGLHFTEELLGRLRSAGVQTAFVTLHVGWDSFRLVKDEDPTSHRMHSEYFELPEEAADAINRAKAEGRRVVSVGTTAVRLLEQAALLADRRERPPADRRRLEERPVEQAALLASRRECPPAERQRLRKSEGWADLFILPGHRFRVVDALLTNFHLPRSTLLMLTCAFAGRDVVVDAYREAVDRRYRFYSFGDCMLVV